MKKAFVFVVCGGREHIETLNFSLKALKRFSEFLILVVTDLKRNETRIEHAEGLIVDVQAPAEFDNHQASIFLKTGLHRFIPLKNTTFCYLDTDVVALSEQVSEVFNHFVEPVVFCSDHCRMNRFSSSAVNCTCDQKPNELQGLIDEYTLKYPNAHVIQRLLHKWKDYIHKFPFQRLKDSWYNQFVDKDDTLREKRDRLIGLTNPELPLYTLIFNYLFRVFPLYRRSFSIKKWSDWKGHVLVDEGPNYHNYMNKHGYYFETERGMWVDDAGVPVTNGFQPFDAFFCEKGFIFNKSEAAWYTTDGKLFLPDITKEIEKRSEFRYHSESDTWYDSQYNPVFQGSCNHLKDRIQEDYGVVIGKSDWQHWNGGLFLFNESSTEFMDTWHRLTLNTFSKPDWKTRDQGTLIATAWMLGLENQALLPITFNFIADYNHPTMIYEGGLSFRLRPNNEPIKPSFVHIYHHWGDTDWDVWNDVVSRVSS